MKPLKLTAMPEDREDRIPPSIVVHNMSDKYFCTIWADERFTFNPVFEYDVNELDQVRDIQKIFFTVYNSILEKDIAIQRLQAENNELMKEIVFNLSPVNERQ